MKSSVVKRSIVLAGHKTSVDIDREHGNLSSTLRLFVLGHYQKCAASGLVVDNFARAAEHTNVQ
jgi:predicted DNA-binding ribbon-helix-helix protein